MNLIKCIMKIRNSCNIHGFKLLSNQPSVIFIATVTGLAYVVLHDFNAEKHERKFTCNFSLECYLFRKLLLSKLILRICRKMLHYVIYIRFIYFIN